MFTDALKCAKVYFRTCQEQGNLSKETDAEIYIARIFFETGQFEEALFKVLAILTSLENEEGKKNLEI